jgi:flagellar biosynthesis/type III secretory pathway M-ring protein FliF/YscJ
MAKKIRKTGRRTTPKRLFVLLIVPWVVMGGLIVVLFHAGAPDYLAILGGLAGSLAVIYYIREHEGRRRLGQ